MLGWAVLLGWRHLAGTKALLGGIHIAEWASWRMLLERAAFLCCCGGVARLVCYYAASVCSAYATVCLALVYATHSRVLLILLVMYMYFTHVSLQYML